MGQYPPSPGLPLDRAQLKREIHAQLKRVGCYRGAIAMVNGPQRSVGPLN